MTLLRKVFSLECRGAKPKKVLLNHCKPGLYELQERFGSWDRNFAEKLRTKIEKAPAGIRQALFIEIQ